MYAYVDYLKYGKDWERIASKIGSRTPEQVRSHAQKILGRSQRKREEKEVKENAKKKI